MAPPFTWVGGCVHFALQPAVSGACWAGRGIQKGVVCLSLSGGCLVCLPSALACVHGSGFAGG